MLPRQPIGISLMTLAILLSSCQASGIRAAVIDRGSTQADVRAELGDPDRVQEFEMPEDPFFGPQETLTELIPPGMPVLEWVFTEGNEELYVWFAAEGNMNSQEWPVVATGIYRAGAFY